MRILNSPAVILLAFLSARCGRGPSNYDDCILQYVKAGMDTAAVVAVRHSCRTKFPESSGGAEQGGVRDLSAEELQLLTGRAGLSFGNTYSVNLYNGNERLHLTRVEIVVGTTISKAGVERTYRSDVNIGPKSTGALSFDIIVGDTDAKYEWRISQAWGRPSQ